MFYAEIRRERRTNRILENEMNVKIVLRRATPRRLDWRREV